MDSKNRYLEKSKNDKTIKKLIKLNEYMTLEYYPQFIMPIYFVKAILKDLFNEIYGNIKP
jgi:hypothetical protein